MRFNPRTRTGCDDNVRDNIAESAGFNPRTRTGCDAPEMVALRTLFRFNPRTRTGCDTRRLPAPGQQRVSIHAPARGATPVFSFLNSCPRFQSTHPHGVRHPLPHHALRCLRVSIHAPARGATHHGEDDGNGKRVSIHAPARGATPNK